MSASDNMIPAPAVRSKPLIIRHLPYFIGAAALVALAAGMQFDGYILNIQSTGAYRASAGNSLYQASKFGVRALSEALIDEYRNSNVRISSVSPGPVDTNIWSHKVEPPEAARRALMMRPSDIADILVWLLDRPRRLHIPNITVTPWTGI